MTTLSEFNRYGEDLERILLLRTSPMAVKMLEKEEDVPDGAIRPKRDRGYHIAQCQAFAMSRRQKDTVAMLKEDNWCFAPLIAYGLVDKPDDPELQQFVSFPTFERDRYVGIVSAPLRTANFEPDVVLIYSNTAQMRSLFLPVHLKGGAQVNSCFFPPACAYQVVPVMSDGQFMVTLPDPGDYQRALAGEDEIILSVPKDKIEEMVTGIRQSEEGESKKYFSYTHTNMLMLHDFPQPEFYQRLFARWGLDKGE
jgi:uncharacterized protein (DUF169 family)